MKHLISLLCLILLITSSAFSGHDKQKSRSFTNHDLEKYKNRPDSEPNKETGPVRDYTKSTNSAPSAEDNAQERKRYIIPYIPYEGTARRIIVPVTFNDRVTARMLVDTGAPGVHISHNLAAQLGIMDNDAGKVSIMVSGIGGSIPAIYTIIDKIGVGEAESHFIPTIISRPISSHFEGLIGMDFMANYLVRVDTNSHVLILEELPFRPDMPGGHNEEWWRLTFRKFKSMRATWDDYRKKLKRLDNDFSHIRKIKEFADKQYEEADALLTRLRVHASENSVPLEWR